MILQVLVLVTFLCAGYQDMKIRKVTDFIWMPAIAGISFTFLFAPVERIPIFASVAVVGVIAFFITRAGLLGQADGIAFVFMLADPAPYAPLPILISVATVTVAHISYLSITHKTGRQTISLDKFKSEAQWIPRAVIDAAGKVVPVVNNVNLSREYVETLPDKDVKVQVQYGAPTVSYIAVGYVIYIAYLALFQPHFLFMLP